MYKINLTLSATAAGKIGLPNLRRSITYSCLKGQGHEIWFG